MVAGSLTEPDTNLVIAALLHDVLEDTPTTKEELASQFGSDVGDLVVEVTDDNRSPKRIPYFVLVGRPNDSLSANPSFHIRIGPAERASALGVRANIVHQFTAKVGNGSKYSAGDHVALDFRKPDLHLIQPGRIRWREVKPHLGMLGQELLDRRGFVGRKIVEHDVNLTGPLRLSDQLSEKRHELGTGVPPCRFSLDRAGLHVQAAYSDRVP